MVRREYTHADSFLKTVLKKLSFIHIPFILFWCLMGIYNVLLCIIKR